jgi:hypothetical protein
MDNISFSYCRTGSGPHVVNLRNQSFDAFVALLTECRAWDGHQPDYTVQVPLSEKNNNGYVTSLMAPFDKENKPIRQALRSGTERAYRNRANVVERSFIALDFDQQPVGTLASVKEWLSTYADQCLLYTTASHLQPGKGERFRLIVVTDRPMMPDEIAPATYAYFNTMQDDLPDLQPIDNASFVGAQPMYLPPHGSNIHTQNGEPVCVNELLDIFDDRELVLPALARLTSDRPATPEDIERCGDWLQWADDNNLHVENSQIWVCCPFHHEHTTGSAGDGNDGGAVILLPTEKQGEARFKCLHSHTALGRQHPNSHQRDTMKSLGVPAALLPDHQGVDRDAMRAAMGSDYDLGGLRDKLRPKAANNDTPDPGADLPAEEPADDAKWEPETVQEGYDADNYDLVDGILPMGISVFYGPSGSGKTYVALCAAFSMAAGVVFANSGTQTGQVIYMAAEGAGTIQARMAMWCDKVLLPLCREYGANFNEYKQRLYRNFRVDTSALDLADRDHTAILKEVIQDMGDVKAVFIDTLSQSMRGDENNASDMASFLKGAQQVFDDTRASVVIIHHAVKSGATIRGSSALLANVDAVIGMSEAAGYHVNCVVDKKRNGKKADPFSLHCPVFDLPADVIDRRKHINIGIYTAALGDIRNDDSNFTERACSPNRCKYVTKGKKGPSPVSADDDGTDPSFALKRLRKQPQAVYDLMTMRQEDGRVEWHKLLDAIPQRAKHEKKTTIAELVDKGYVTQDPDDENVFWMVKRE